MRFAALSLALGVVACGNDSAPAPSAFGGHSGTGAAGEAPAGAGGPGAGGPSQGGGGGAGVSAGTGGRSGSGGGGGGTEPGTTLADCALSFPYRETAPRGFWLGADSNFSVVLSPTQALMTFQDSFVGGASPAMRAGSTMVGNSVARISCEAGQYSIDYHWGGADEEHRALFDEGREGERLWIHRPWLHAGKLFLTATRVTSDDSGFHELGITLARVQNPLEAPESWVTEYFNLTDQRLTVGKGTYETEDRVYLFTPHENDLLLARIDKLRLLEPSIGEASLEYLKGDGTWAPGLVPASAKRLGLAANTGLTVRYHEASSRFVALFTDTSGWPSASIAVSFASSLEGPWSKPSLVYSVPEMDPRRPGYDAETVCYGAAEHAAFNQRPDAELVFTYTCNSLSFEKLLSGLDIYVPRVVIAAMPRSASQGCAPEAGCLNGRRR